MAKQRLPILQDTDSSVKSNHKRRLPDWFKVSLPTGDSLNKFNKIKSTITENTLNTVCTEARCPNIHECWSRGTATFMIAGQECTRGCRFCAVGSVKSPPPLDVNEPENLALAVKNMNLEHAVITVVNRDDLEDSGANHYRKCLEKVRELCPSTSLELLCSDLAGDRNVLSTVRIILFLLDILDILLRSEIVIIGFVGVSIKIIFVLSVMFFSIDFNEEVSTQ